MTDLRAILNFLHLLPNGAVGLVKSVPIHSIFNFQKYSLVRYLVITFNPGREMCKSWNK